MTYRHIVLFRVYDSASATAVDSAIGSLQALSKLPVVEALRVERSLDGRKGRIIVLDATFGDRDAFDAYRADPRHVAVAAQLATISDWWVGDYEVA